MLGGDVTWTLQAPAVFFMLKQHRLKFVPWAFPCGQSSRMVLLMMVLVLVGHSFWKALPLHTLNIIQWVTLQVIKPFRITSDDWQGDLSSVSSFSFLSFPLLISTVPFSNKLSSVLSDSRRISHWVMTWSRAHWVMTWSFKTPFLSWRVSSMLVCLVRASSSPLGRWLGSLLLSELLEFWSSVGN